MTTCILYLRPSDPSRTAIAGYGEDFLGALRGMAGVEVVDLLPADLSERIDSRADRDAIERFVQNAAREYAGHESLIVHVEQGMALHREFWAGRFLQRRLPRARFFCTLHDAPRLCSNPYRHVRTEFEGHTPIRLLNVALTRAAEAWAGWGKHRVERRFLARCEAVVALTRGGAELLRGDARFRGVRVEHLPLVSALENLEQGVTAEPSPLPLSLGKGEGGIRGEQLEREWGVSRSRKGGPLCIVFFGFLAPNKGLEELIAAFEIVLERLKREGAQARPRLRIAGGISSGFAAERYLAGVRERIARSSAREGIDFAPGYVSDAQRDRMLEEAAVVALPYHATGQVVAASSALVRAMGLGKAVVATRTGAFAEEIHDGTSGLLYAEGDAQELAKQLGRLVKEPELRARLGKAAQSHVEAEHSPERVARGLRAIYRVGREG